MYLNRRLSFLFVSALSFSSSIISIGTGLASTGGVISGSIVDDQGIAIPGASVQIMDSSGKVVQEVKSSPTGTFEFLDVSIGDYQIKAQSKGFAPDQEELHVSSSGTSQIDLKMKPQQEVASQENSPPKEMVVEVKAKKRLIQTHTSTSRSEINQEQVRKLPQGSEASLSKLISSTTPGVVQGSFGQMFFRGSHANIQYQIDGVQMPESPSNSFGPAFSPRNFDRMEVITGGIPAEYGQRLGAVLNIVTKTGPEEPSGELELNYGSYNTISPHLLYGGSNKDGDIHYYFGLNYNRTDRGIDTPQPVSPTDSSQGGRESVHNNAHGDSEFAKVDWQVNNSNKLSFIAFHSYNHYEIPNYPASFVPTDPYFSAGFPNPFSNLSAGGGHGHHGHGEQGHHDHGGHGHHEHGGHEHHDHCGHGHHDHEHGHHHGSKPKKPKAPKPETAHTTNAGPTFNYVPSNTNDTQSEQNAYLQTVWKHTISEKSFLQLAPYYKYSQIVVTADPENDLATAPGGSLAGVIPGANPISFAQNRHINNLGLKGDYSHRVHEQHLLKTGFQTQVSRSDGVVSFQTSLLNPAVASNVNGTGYFEGVYVQDDYAITKRLVLNAGLRFDAVQFRFDDGNSSDSLLQPRIGLSYMATDTTKLHVFYGRLFQPAALENLRKQFNTVNPNPAPYDIKAQKDHYYEVGVDQQVLEKQVVSFNLFYKNSINVLDDAQLLRTSLVQPYNFAEGYAYGAELSIRGQITQDWSEYANYSYVIAKGRDISGGVWATGVPDTHGYQYLDHVQIHTANAGVTYTKNQWWWSGQGVFGSGLRTGEDNMDALPAHFTMDTTLGYEFRGNSWLSNFRLSGDVLNILDNRYPITIANAYNSSHYAVGRQFFLRWTKML